MDKNVVKPQAMGKFFNTAGPDALEDHYMLDPLLIRQKLIRQKWYCVLRAPRQTGKTTSLLMYLLAVMFLPSYNPYL
jgi:hypothetical protein